MPCGETCSGQEESVQNVADRPMRRSALEEERRNSRHMNLNWDAFDALRFGGVDKNAAKNGGPDGTCKPKPNDPTQGRFVSQNPGRSGEEESHQSSQWGLEALVSRDPCKVSVTKVCSLGSTQRFQVFWKFLSIKIKPQHHAGEFGLIGIGSQNCCGRL